MRLLFIAHAKPRPSYGGGKRPTTRSSKCKLPAKKRKLLINEIISEDHEISEEVLSVFWGGLHFKEYQVRCAFHDLFNSDQERMTVFINCISQMQLIYKKLLKKYCVGKKFLQMQQAWVLYINFYIIGEKASDVDGLTMDDKQECCTVWSSVVDIAEKSNLSLPVQEQRIIVSSLVYAVFDAMAKEVKEKKINDKEQFLETPHKETISTMCRYAGAALHFMTEKRKKYPQNTPS